jgi:hypothetical protein
MFQSYAVCRYLGIQNGKYSFKYELIDSEFGFVSDIASVDTFNTWVSTTSVVIQEYSRRNMDVASNLMRVFIWHNKLYPNYSIQRLIDYNKQYNPLFLQYEEDLQKYIVLL